MAMRPCEKCLENQWTYKVLEDKVTIEAECKHCGATVTWVSKKLERKAKRVYPEFKPHFTREQIESQTGEPPW